MNRFVKDFGKYFFYLLVAAFMVSCGGDEDPSPSITTDFTYTADATTPGKINFTNTSANASSYIWHFGDGSTSTEASPSHTYLGNGTYEVKLIAMNGSGSGGKLPGKDGGSGAGPGVTKTVTITNSQSTLIANMTGSSNFTYTGSPVQAVRNGSQIIITGNDSGILMELRVPINAVAGGTYTAASSNASITYTTSIDSYFANSSSCTGSNGTIKVTSISATNISGTFSGKVYRASCGGYFTINSGNFSVKF